jgi:hypothetical protein
MKRPERYLPYLLTVGFLCWGIPAALVGAVLDKLLDGTWPRISVGFFFGWIVASIVFGSLMWVFLERRQPEDTEAATRSRK